MKFRSACCFIVALASLLAASLRGDPSAAPQREFSKDFQRIAKLAGTWTGQADLGQGMQAIKATYRVTAGGSAVEEVLFAGTDSEMVSIYHDEGGALAMTHYCKLGNQPHMKIKGSDDHSLTLAMQDTQGISDAKAPHMHGLTLRWVDDKTIEQAWSLYVVGEEKEVHTIKLTRAP